jgi:hypothetical protein
MEKERSGRKSERIETAEGEVEDLPKDSTLGQMIVRNKCATDEAVYDFQKLNLLTPGKIALSLCLSI